MPTGGVTSPIASPMMKIAPNCQSLTPMARIGGVDVMGGVTLNQNE